MEIKGKTALEVWRKILDKVMAEGGEFEDRKDRLCKEYLNMVAVIETTEGITKPIEILNKFNKWLYPSPNQIKASILGKDPNVSEYYYNYGQRAFNFNGMDQINDYIIPLLRKNPTSKRAIVVIGDPMKDAFVKRKEVPGLSMMNFHIRGGKIHSTMVIRSNDMFYGWPGNIAQAYYIAEYLSKELNYPIGTITTVSVSAHIFGNQFQDIYKVIGK